MMSKNNFFLILFLKYRNITYIKYHKIGKYIQQEGGKSVRVTDVTKRNHDIERTYSTHARPV